MSTRLKEKQEKIHLIIEKLVEASAKGNPVVVEGKKDEQALRMLGVTGIVLTVKTGGKSLLEFCEDIETLGAREVVLLLDFDRRGKETTAKLKGTLERARIKSDTRFWRELQALTGREIRCIESLPTYICNLKQKAAVTE